jgi:SAM-dependent methyltransferase
MHTMSLDEPELEIYIDILEKLGYGKLNYDALWKWASLLMLSSKYKDKITDIEESLIIEAGGGWSPVAPILSKIGYNVRNIDKNFNDMWFDPSNHMRITTEGSYQMISGDFLEYIKRIPDESVDVVLDGCSIIHFNTSATNINEGLYQSALEIKRVLKKDGIFIIASDSLYPDSNRIADNNGEMLYPERLLQCIENAGLKSLEELEIRCRPEAVLEVEKDGNQSNKLSFGKCLEGWETKSGIRLTATAGAFSK